MSTSTGLSDGKKRSILPLSSSTPQHLPQQQQQHMVDDATKRMEAEEATAPNVDPENDHDDDRMGSSSPSSSSTTGNGGENEIHCLSIETIRQLTAEQAIADLVGIVKELVDNALDAESTTIKGTN